MLLASAPTLLLSNHLSFSAKKYLYHCMKVDVIQPENLQAISLVAFGFNQNNAVLLFNQYLHALIFLLWRRFCSLHGRTMFRGDV